MVHRALEPHHTKFRVLCWAFPASFYSVTIGVSSLLLTILDIAVSGLLGAIMVFKDIRLHFPIIPAALVSASNAALNVYATIFITIRLIHRRRLAIVCFMPTALTMQLFSTTSTVRRGSVVS